MRITNVEKKELSDIFKGLKLNIFDFEATGEYEQFKIKFKYDYFSFNIVKQKPSVYLIEYFSVDNKNPVSGSMSWNDLIKNFQSWSQKLVSELNSSTGWESFENTNFFDIEFEELNGEFTVTEKLETKQNIIQLKAKIKLLNLAPDKLEIIEHKLDILSSKVDELNKFDWKSLFVGTIASLIMALVIPPEAAGIIWNYVKNSFSNLKTIS
ncbi:hypothetical protein [Flavobacterium sp. LHD-85]|uniref:hypothetical protein n=1 Tax=Flavobacterium sp. LHD-85 TaxID=3071410 RepID=UPI0027E197A4|nr:hypothetical protein [Flavobacterium sp. LHD-85]MDQ6531153.1 hypothetical protein [Flavobacterium sp. LHD-85]